MQGRRYERTDLRMFREDDREGLAPIPLPGKQPVPELVVDLLPPAACALQPGQHPLLSLLLFQPIQAYLPRVHA